MKIIKENKKIIIIFISAIILVIGLVVGGINIANAKEYKEVKTQYKEVLGESIDLGLIHRKEEIDQAIVDFDAKVEKYQNKIDSKVKSLSFDVKEFIKTNEIKVPIGLKEQIKLLDTLAIVDNVKIINNYDNYKPKKTNDAIKKEVKDIDTKASASYDLVVKEISTKLTVSKDDVIKFIKDLDFKKTLNDAQKKSLKTINTIDFSDEFIKQISDAKAEIKKIVDNIKKEEKVLKDKDIKKAQTQGGGSGAVSSGKYTGSGSTSNVSSMNDWCKQNYGSQGWTQWYPSEGLCGYPPPKHNKVGYDRTMAQQIFTEVNKHRAEVGVGQLSYNSAQQSCADKEAETFYKTQNPHPMVCGTQGSTNHGVGGNAIGPAYYGLTAKEYVNLWINSPGHEANQTNENFTSVSISVYNAPDGAIYIEAMYYG